MLRIPTAKTSFESIPITLSGETYVFTYRFNSRSKRWKLDISDSSGNDIINGITIIEESILTRHLSLPVGWEGFLACFQVKNGDRRVGRDNLGIDNTHELLFFTYEELES